MTTTTDTTTYTVEGYRVYAYMVADLFRGFRRWMSVTPIFETIEEGEAHLFRQKDLNPNTSFELREVRNYPQPSGSIRQRAERF